MHIYILISFNTWVENMASSDIDYNALEKEANRATVKKSYHIDFASKTIKECRYIKTFAEVELQSIQDVLALIILLLAMGTGLIPTFPLYGAIGFFIAFLLFQFLYKRLNNNCRRIVLDAEKRILSEDTVEPKQPQETTNAPQAQENTSSKGQSRGQIEYIKAKLDFLKIMISAFIVGIFGFGVYIFQSQKPNIIYVLVGIIILCVPFFMAVKLYRENMDKLQVLP